MASPVMAGKQINNSEPFGMADLISQEAGVLAANHSHLLLLLYHVQHLPTCVFRACYKFLARLHTCLSQCHLSTLGTLYNNHKQIDIKLLPSA